MDEDIRMERDHLVFAEPPTSAANVAHDHAQAAAGDEEAKALSPHLVELAEKNAVVVEVAELVPAMDVLDEIEIGWRRDDQLHGLLGQGSHITRVAEDDTMRGLEGVLGEELTMDLELVRNGRLAAIDVMDSELGRLTHPLPPCGV